MKDKSLIMLEKALWLLTFRRAHHGIHYFSFNYTASFSLADLEIFSEAKFSTNEKSANVKKPK